MKKIILSLALMIALIPCTNAYSYESEIISVDRLTKINKRIDEIGFRILNSNGIEKRTTFNYSTKKVKNAYSKHSNREIVMFEGLYIKLSSDDEIAAILAHEISHSVDSYQGILRGYFSNLSYYLSPKKYELKADKRAVDYLVNAGYNPVAIIVTLNKIAPQTRYEWCSTHPLTSRRLEDIYEYIYKKYPEYLVNNVYKENPYYQNFLLTSKQARAKFQNRVSKNI